jgi:ABC-type Mn2+/Zn2+ transport system permease subunit
MTDFWMILSFSWIPFAGAICFAVAAAPLGSILSLRDEILLGLALPPVGTAMVVAAVWTGVSPDRPLLLYIIAVAGILVVSLLMPRKSDRPGGSPRWRSAFLASIFCAGEAATILISSVSTSVEAHLQHMLRGELLTIGLPGLIGFGVLTAVVAGLGFHYRGFLLALAIDEESLAIKNRRRAAQVRLAFRVLSAMIIASGVIWVGPLLTMGLLAIPTMFLERHSRGLLPLIAGVALVATLGVAGGFLGSIALDLPPVPVVIGMLFLVGTAWAWRAALRSFDPGQTAR